MARMTSSTNKVDELGQKMNGAFNNGGDDTKADAEESSDSVVFKMKVKDVFEKNGRKFNNEILPKLPKLPNGMTLLGINEQSPLIDCNEIYKLRVFRPDTPLAYSEVFEDNCTIRFTNLSRLLNDDLSISKFKLETAVFRVGAMEEDQIGTKAIKGLYEAEDACNMTFRHLMDRKIKELMMLSLEIATTKKLRESEVRDLKERCLTMYGGKCNTGKEARLCDICLIKDQADKLTGHFDCAEAKSNPGKVIIYKILITRSIIVQIGYYKKLETLLTGLLKKAMPTKSLLLTIDRIEQIVMVCGLELLRFAANIHLRGIRLGGACRLDHLINMCRAALQQDVLIDCTSFADTMESNITAWNDNEFDKPDHRRTHLMIYEGKFLIGFGVNVIQKRNWNGINLEGLKETSKRTKLRVLIHNDDLETVFTPPIFNVDKGTFSSKDIKNLEWEDLGKPLIPASSNRMSKTLIR